ncbi:unnamed protein product [Dimorphilus gyrociliatus]|uniref:Uncharacterized protein n=1 Tax=Dimorphilus gyrociliatus TaxID=2664684 RepID=A0A7I8WF14_9ANNE|nr:unnamed protein product [Dimorphilus gyrociliatus]
MNLTEINIADNEDLHKCLEMISESLENCSHTIKILNFSNCMIDQENGVALAKLLYKCEYLEEINPSFSRELDHRYSGITSEIFKRLESSVLNLKAIQISFQHLDTAGKNQFIHLLAKCLYLRKLVVKADANQEIEIKCRTIEKVKAKEESYWNMKLSPWIFDTRKDIFLGNSRVILNHQQNLTRNDSLLETIQEFHKIQLSQINFLPVIDVGDVPICSSFDSF